MLMAELQMVVDDRLNSDADNPLNEVISNLIDSKLNVLIPSDTVRTTIIDSEVTCAAFYDSEGVYYADSIKQLGCYLVPNDGIITISASLKNSSGYSQSGLTCSVVENSAISYYGSGPGATTYIVGTPVTRIIVNTTVSWATYTVNFVVRKGTVLVFGLYNYSNGRNTSTSCQSLTIGYDQ